MRQWRNYPWESFIATIRLDEKHLIDFIVKKALEIADRHSFPIQFHTGFGDNDLSLIRSNPLLLTPMIEKYKKTKFIILHSSWPYYRESSYLTALYHNVWLDLSLMIPFVSTGIAPALREIFGIVPFN